MENQEEMFRNDVERRDLLRYTESTIATAEQVIGSLKRSVNDVRISLKHDEESVEYLFDSPSERLAEVCSELFSSLRRNTILLHQAVQFSPSFIQESSHNDHTFSEYDTSIPKENRVVVRLENNGIFIRIPMLWSTNFRMRNNKMRAEALIERDVIFAAAVRQGILNTQNFDCFDTSGYIEKTVHFLYVYPASGRYSSLATDNENHLTKNILDAATQLLPGGDSAFSCSIYSSATRSDEVISGTYLTILPGRDSIMSSEKILSFWHREQEKMPKCITENSNFSI